MSDGYALIDDTDANRNGQELEGEEQEFDWAGNFRRWYECFKDEVTWRD